MIISAVLMTGVKINYEMSRAKIEMKARGYGMRYPAEMQIIIDEDVKK